MGRKRLERVPKLFRVAVGTSENLGKLATQHGFEYGSSGGIGKLLDAIGSGQFVIISQENWEKLKEVAGNL